MRSTVLFIFIILCISGICFAAMLNFKRQMQMRSFNHTCDMNDNYLEPNWTFRQDCRYEGEEDFHD